MGAPHRPKINHGYRPGGKTVQLAISTATILKEGVVGVENSAVNTGLFFFLFFLILFFSPGTGLKLVYIKKNHHGKRNEKLIFVELLIIMQFVNL